MKNLFFVLFTVVSLAGFVSCEKDAGDHMHDAGESVQEAAEETGDAISDGVEEAGDEMEDAADDASN